MTDVAELGFKAKTDELVTADNRLDKLSIGARKAERATDRLRRGFDTVGSRASVANAAVGAMGSTMRKVGGIVAGLAAGIASGLSLRKFIDATIEADKVQTQLGAALLSTKASSGQTIGSLNANAAALQKITNFGDEATNAAQALLLTFTNIKDDVFPQATQAVQNVATAMGTDLKSAALQVGKALNDPVQGISALSRSGITFSETQKTLIKDLVKTGDIVGAQTIILKELENQFGGSAAAARLTLGGALTSLGNAFGDLFELTKSASEPLRLVIENLISAISDPSFVAFAQTIGSILFGAFGLAVKGITAIVNGISFLTSNIDFLKIAMIGLLPVFASIFGPAIIGAIVSVSSAIGVGLVGAVRLLTLSIAANPLGLLAVAISSVIGYLIIFRDEMQIVAGEAATLGDYLRAIWSFIGDAASAVVGFIVDRWNWLTSQIGSAFDMIFDWASDTFGGISDTNLQLSDVIKSVVNTMIGVYLGGFNAIKSIWSNLPAAIGEAAYGAVNLVISALDFLIEKSTKGVNLLIASLNNIPGVTIGEVSAGKIGEIDNPYAGATDNLIADAKTAVTDAINVDYVGAAKEALGGLGESLKERANEIRTLRDEDTAMNQALNASGVAANAAKDSVDALGGAAGGAAKKTKELNDELKESASFAKDLVSGAIGDLRSALEDGKITVREFTDVFLNALDKIVDKLLNNVLDAMFQVNDAGQIGGGGGAGGGFASFLTTAFSSLFKPSALGNAFNSTGRVTKYASGGVIGSATPFQSRSGELGVMGEAGPEAILPLTRTRGGELGVKAQPGGNNASGTIVQIIDQRGADAPPIREESSQTSDGRELKKFIIATVQEATSKGRFDGTQGKRFGAKPVGVVR